jgi:predicted dehydrogenase
LAYLTDALPARVHAEEIRYSREPAHRRDSVTITLRMTDGSVGAIHYLADGDPGLAKEYLEVFGGQRAALLDNYRALTLHSGNKRKRERLMNQAKGHAEEVAAFVNAVRSGDPMPIPLETILAVSAATFAVHTSLDRGAPADVPAATDLT